MHSLHAATFPVNAGQERGASIEAMLAEEAQTQVPADFLSLQPLIGAQHRQLLASWIVAVRALRPSALTLPPCMLCSRDGRRRGCKHIVTGLRRSLAARWLLSECA